TADGVPVSSNDALRNIFSESDGEPVKIEFTRDGEELSADITPVYSAADGCYSAGIWVRDSLAGVGTMTFYDPKSCTFGGLGHPICDGDTGVCIPIGEGSACPISISSLIKSQSGDPGMLEGTFQKGNNIGTLLSNSSCGVFGKLSSDIPEGETVPMAFKQEIEEGEAEIICTISGEEPQHYTIIIEDIDYNGTDNTKNMVIRITDKDLLKKTGGIVQGMSGSPIIQNGKLAGAVTHVFVDDPERGYGIFCENMYRQCISIGG
ncbi:MAG: SpoIVB peptidase, partial [Oscillospiraceae bacterium]|nr:SpoIVB peptidase [Oscillospiraceae bacterium]